MYFSVWYYGLEGSCRYRSCDNFMKLAMILKVESERMSEFDLHWYSSDVK